MKPANVSRAGPEGDRIHIIGERESEMGEATQWRYLTAHVFFQVTKTRLFSAEKEGYWAIQLDQEYQLETGLNLLGAQGYELVAIQPAFMKHGGNVAREYFPQSIYIFKQRIT